MNLRDETRAWIIATEPGAMATCSYGYAVDPIVGAASIKHLLNRAQRQAFGRRWAQVPAEYRLSAIGVWERVHRWGNTHCHVLVAGPKPVLRILRGWGAFAWEELQPRGQLHVRPIRSQNDAASYITKCLSVNPSDAYDRLFIY